MRKPIPSFPDYLVSDDGDVFNQYGMKFSPYDSNGYRRTSLNCKKRKKRIGVDIHRLVVETFIGPIPKGMWVNHKNGKKDDNRLENLEIVTPSVNHKHARDVLKRKYANGEKVHTAKLNIEAVEAVRFLAVNGWSNRKIAKAFLVSQPSICNILNNKSWKE